MRNSDEGMYFNAFLKLVIQEKEYAKLMERVKVSFGIK